MEIHGVKIGNVVNLSIEGKLFKKNCGNTKEANELFQLVLKAKENPTPENVKAIRVFINDKTRVAFLAGLESDVDTGEVYLAGFNTPLPLTLIEVIKEYHENGYPLEAVINFWKLLMINPDKRVRTSLFDFIKTHDFVLTDKGYMVVYKAVYTKEDKILDSEKKYVDFISEKYLHVRNVWKCSPNKYVVYKNLGDDSYGFTKFKTAEKWDEEDKNIEILGKLDALYNSIFNGEKTGRENTPVYTDMYTQSMHIELGTPVNKERKECDANPVIECSNGLHVGATKYVENYASNKSKPVTILVCFVNPANVVAVPDHDKTKMRTSEYFPFAVASFENKKISIIEQMYYEDDYCDYEHTELEKQIAKVKAEELPIDKAKNAEAEVRPMAELMKMLETRLVDIE